MNYILEHNDLLEKVKVIDVRHEFQKEWENDTEMLKTFIDLNIGNFLPSNEDTFGSYLTNLMHFKGLTKTVLAERTGALEWRRVSLGAHWVDSRESSLLRRLERGREIGL